MRPLSVRRPLPAFALLSAILATPLAVSAQTSYLASDLSPASSLSSQFNGAGGNSASGNTQYMAPTRDFPDARGTDSFVWNNLTLTSTTLAPSHIVGTTTYVQSNTSTQFVGALNESDGFGGSHYVGLIWNSPSAAPIRLDSDAVSNSYAFVTDGTHQAGQASYQDGFHGQSIPYVWSGSAESGHPLDIPPDLDGASYSGGVTGISAGRMSGYAFGDADGMAAALYWPDENDKAQVLRPAGYDETFGKAIDGSKMLVEGYGAVTGGPRHLYIVDVDHPEDPWTDLHPVDPAVKYSYGYAISGNTQVGAVAIQDPNDPGGSFEHAALWNGTAESYIDLANSLPPGYVFSRALGIDADGNIYGYASVQPGDNMGIQEYRAFRWSPVASSNSTWAATTTANFASPTSWTGSVPSGTTATATFASTTGGTLDVNVASPALVASLVFGAGGTSFNLTGPGPLTVQGYQGGHGTVTVLAGNHAIATPLVIPNTTDFTVPADSTLAISGAISGAGDLQKQGEGTLVLSGPLSYQGLTFVYHGNLIANTPIRTPNKSISVVGEIVDGSNPAAATLAAPASTSAYTVAGEFSDVVVGAHAMLTVAAHNSNQLTRVLVANSLTVDIQGTLDLGNNDAIVHNGDETLLRSLVASWYHNGTYDGFGLAASQTTGLTTLAVFPNNDFYSSYDGVTLVAGDVLIKYTYLGDTNLDGIVDAADLANAIEGLSTGATGWQNGDFNYDGAVTPDDIALLSAVLDAGVSPLGNGQAADGSSGSIPEPTALLPLLLTTPLVSRRRR